MLNIALPKGRLGDQVYKLFSSIGYECAAIYQDNRKLVFENPDNQVRYLLVKPSDVAIYVEYGAADVGVVGKDILLESRPDVYELLDLNIGKCRLCVAAPDGYVEDRGRVLRVATKFAHAQRLHRAGPHPGAVRRDRGHRGVGQDPGREPPPRGAGDRAHLRPVHREPVQLPV